MPRVPAITLAAAASLCLASTASADSLLQSAPGARNLAAGGGYLAWAAPADGGRWKLMLRAPDGTVTTPAIPTFGAPPDASIGSDRTAIDDRRLLAVYSRCEGTSAVKGCNVHLLDVRTGEEDLLPALARGAYSETAPQLNSGTYVAVRRGGPRPGVYRLSARSGLKRVSSVVPKELAASATRFLTVERTAGGTHRIVTRRLSGDGQPRIFASGLLTPPRSLVITRYRAGWLAGSRVFQTTRFAGSGGPYSATTREGNRALPATVDSIATDSSNITRYLDGEGIKAVAPKLFP